VVHQGHDRQPMPDRCRRRGAAERRRLTSSPKRGAGHTCPALLPRARMQMGELYCQKGLAHKLASQLQQGAGLSFWGSRREAPASALASR
jgi:hypothetical protein